MTRLKSGPAALGLAVLAAALALAPALRASASEVYGDDDLKAQLSRAVNDGEPVTLKRGRYVLTKAIAMRLRDGSSVSLSIPEGVVIEAGTGQSQISGPVIHLVGGRVADARVEISGGGTLRCVNCSSGWAKDATGAVRSVPGGSGLAVSNAAQAIIRGLRLEAGVDEDGNGDSGLVILNVRTAIVSDLVLRGWDDLGIYVSGSATEDGSDAGQSVTIERTTFDGNHGGVASKRRFNKVTVRDSLFTNNFVDIGVMPTGNNGTGRTVVATGNRFVGTRRNVVDARGDPDNAAYAAGDFDSVRFEGNMVCRPFQAGLVAGAALLVNRGRSSGMIYSKGNLFDRSTAGAAPVYYQAAKTYKGFAVANDRVVDGCR